MKFDEDWGLRKLAYPDHIAFAERRRNKAKEPKAETAS